MYILCTVSIYCIHSIYNTQLHVCPSVLIDRELYLQSAGALYDVAEVLSVASTKSRVGELGAEHGYATVLEYVLQDLARLAGIGDPDAGGGLSGSEVIAGAQKLYRAR